MNRFAFLTVAAMTVGGMSLVGCDNTSDTGTGTGTAAPAGGATGGTGAGAGAGAANTNNSTTGDGPITRGINKIDNSVGATAASKGHAGNPNDPADTARVAAGGAAPNTDTGANNGNQ
jgi:hypothetical protein